MATSTVQSGYEWWRKPLRTIIQVVAGLGVTTVVGVIAPHIPKEDYAIMFGAVTVILGAVQNYAEQEGWVPIILPSGHPTTAVVKPAEPAPKV